jgi:rod shape-determining protein MreC
MDVLGRYRNLIVLVGVLFAQVLGLAVQVKRTTDSESTRLIRIWAVDTVTPLEKALVWAQTSTSNLWHNYFYLRGVRAENRTLKAQIERMSLEQVRMSQDADQARRLQALLAFKEQFISQTMAAQVIGSSGSELSRSVYIDKGERDGIKPDMAVITADGIVGKVLRVYGSTSLVLLIDDQTSGVGALLDKTRLQGILRGTPSGEVVLEKVMSDETVPAGEMVLTSGGDGIFPKGLLVGRVTKVAPGSELFLNIRVRPAADLSKLEEVLVVTKIDERQAEPDQTGATRAIDILAERLPKVPAKPENAVKADAAGAVAPGTVAPTTLAPTTAAPTNTGLGVKPKAVPAEASAASGTPAAQKKVSPASSSSGPKTTAAGTPTMKDSPQPVKATVEPKPQPAVEDSPH